MKLSVIAIADQVQTEHDAYVFLERLRWNGHPVCPHCGNAEKCYYLKPTNGTTTRKTRTGAGTQRRVWKCGACRKQFSVLTGTIFHGTKISVRKWLFVVFEMCANKNGCAAREIERRYDLTPKTAWFMLHRIREAMRREPLAGMLRGTVVVDETYMGGKPKNRHRQGRPQRLGTRRTGGVGGKTPVLSLINRETGEVRSEVMERVDRNTIGKAIKEQVDTANSHLMTDTGGWYAQVGPSFLSHETVAHWRYEYVRGNVSTNAAEGYFSQLKRSIDGTHHQVTKQHLPRYLAEFDFRYSTCKLSDTARTERLLGQVAGRRLTYRQPSGNSAENPID